VENIRLINCKIADGGIYPKTWSHARIVENARELKKIYEQFGDAEELNKLYEQFPEMAQVAQLTAAGAAKAFKEKVSGAKSDRTQLKKAIAALAKGDALIVTRLDRLARSTRDLLNILAAITDKGAGFKSLVMNGPTPQPRTAGSWLRAGRLG
jgi:hypothetical protein